MCVSHEMQGADKSPTKPYKVMHIIYCNNYKMCLTFNVEELLFHIFFPYKE